MEICYHKIFRGIFNSLGQIKLCISIGESAIRKALPSEVVLPPSPHMNTTDTMLLVDKAARADLPFEM